jgi:hypothetical protein
MLDFMKRDEIIGNVVIVSFFIFMLANSFAAGDQAFGDGKDLAHLDLIRCRYSHAVL